MNSEPNTGRSLWEIEQEVLAAGREWMRRRLQQKLQAEADQHRRVFPPSPKNGRTTPARRQCICAAASASLNCRWSTAATPTRTAGVARSASAGA